MPLLTASLRARLIANGREQLALRGSPAEIDHHPVVKLFAPDSAAIWLLSEIDPDDESVAFGLCDLGSGCPELGSVSLTELEKVRGPLGLHVERDRHFKASMTLRAYADAARRGGRTVA